MSARDVSQSRRARWEESMTAKSLLAAFGSLSLLLLGGCAATTDPASTQSAERQGRWPQFLDRTIQSYFRVNPEFAVNQGRHEFDGQLSDWSGTGLASRASFLRSTIAAAQNFDASDLSEEQRFERDYLMAVMRRDLFWETVA